MKPTTLCPCGSGKPQARCCGENAKTKINRRAIVTWSFVILLGSAITVIAFSRSSGEAPITNVGATPGPSAFGGSSGVSGNQVPAPTNITNPTSWQYDIATDRHYDPNHAHWHSGRAPNDPSRTISSTSGNQVPAPPNITNPTSWQYDVVTDRHYDPSHAHWHSGRAPNDPARTITLNSGNAVSAPPNITNPTSWQYDVATDRHYNPDHAHWHDGPPPPNPP